MISARIAAARLSLALLAVGAVPGQAAARAQAPSPPAAAAVAPTFPPMSDAQIALAVRTLDHAQVEGLPHETISASAPQEAIITALLRYAREVHVGRLDPSDFLKDWGVRPAPYDPGPGLAQALRDDRLAAWLDSLPPPYAGYKGLRQGLAAYRKIAAEGGWKPIPAGPALTLGAKGPRVTALRDRLAVEDSGVAASGPAVFDAELQQALLRAQRRFGLRPTGAADAATLAALNQPVGQRILQILANMERWRWLPPRMPPNRVQVNSGAAVVTLFIDDRPMLSMKAVSGKRDDETPMLLSEIHSIVLNPPWNVPSSIAAKELWPKERAHPGYLQRNGFVVIHTGDGVRLQQKAGTKSSLGRFKFDFDNPYGVYLHDTPTRSTFERYVRQASHGCVRLEKPEDLAVALLADDPSWTREAIEAAVAKGQTQRVRLPASVAVFIFYWTAFAGPDGEMNFRSDPYDWDRILLQKMGVLGPAPETAGSKSE